MFKRGFGFLVSFFIFFVIAYAADTCDKTQLDSFTSCIYSEADSLIKQESSSADKDAEDEIKACFSKSACDIKDLLPANHSLVKDKEFKQKDDECRQTVIKAKQQAVELCTQEDYSDFKISDPLRVDKNDFSIRASFSMQALRKSAEKNCGQKADDIKTCVADVFKKKTNEMQTNRRTKVNKFCEARTSCMNKLSDSCKEKTKKLKSKLCSCAIQKDIPATKDYNTCMGADSSKFHPTNMRILQQAYCNGPDKVCDRPITVNRTRPTETKKGNGQ